MVAERVDDAVERLVRHGLALVAGAGQRHRVRVATLELVDEVPHERTLADAGFAVDEDELCTLARLLGTPPRARRAAHGVR